MGAAPEIEHGILGIEQQPVGILQAQLLEGFLVEHVASHQQIHVIVGINCFCEGCHKSLRHVLFSVCRKRDKKNTRRTYRNACPAGEITACAVSDEIFQFSSRSRISWSGTSMGY